MKNFYLSLFLFFLAGCFCSGGKNRTDSEWSTDMAKQNNVKAQEGTETGQILMKESPKGTRARNRSYYPYTGDPLSAGKNLKNPLEKNTDIIMKGRVYYERYCIYCHGTKGDGGEGATVAPKMFIQPPSLLTGKAKAYSEGRLYHIIYEGQGLMGSYRIQLNTKEQTVLSHYIKDSVKKYRGSESIWSVVNYVRLLQKSSERN